MQILLWTIISYPELSPITMNSQPPIRHHSSAFISALELARSLPPSHHLFLAQKSSIIITSRNLWWVSGREFLPLEASNWQSAPIWRCVPSPSSLRRCCRWARAAQAAPNWRSSPWPQWPGSRNGCAWRSEAENWVIKGIKGDHFMIFHGGYDDLWWFMGIYGTI